MISFNITVVYVKWERCLGTHWYIAFKQTVQLCLNKEIMKEARNFMRHVFPLYTWKNKLMLKLNISSGVVNS